MGQSILRGQILPRLHPRQRYRRTFPEIRSSLSRSSRTLPDDVRPFTVQTTHPIKAPPDGRENRHVLDDGRRDRQRIVSSEKGSRTL